MDVLTLEPLDADVLGWLKARHTLQMAPELAQDPAGLRLALAQARALIVPPSLVIDAAALRRAPRLRIVGRLSAGAQNIDLEACALAGVEVVRPASAGASAEAEFVIAALLQMLRRVPVISPEGLVLGRELGGSTVGLVGLTPAVRHLAPLLSAFGALVLGHDPGVHSGDPLWARSGIEAASLRDLMRQSDAVCVLFTAMPSHAGLFGEQLLAECKRDQVLVVLAHSSVFNEAALARSLREGPLAAAWLDQADPALLAHGRPLRQIDTLQITPRVAGSTLQSRKRSAWALAHRIDERLGDPFQFGAGAGGGSGAGAGPRAGVSGGRTGAPIGLADD
jgi:phosphoglycerate dehydrogenase-like enzyme